MSTIPRKCLLKRSPPDSRDLVFSSPRDIDIDLPPVFDLRNPSTPVPPMKNVLDQGSLGSCGLNATSNSLRHLLEKEGLPVWQPSRLYLYWNTRVNIEHSPANEDTGVCIRDVCKALKKYHACSEEIWPYDIEKFSQAPPLDAYKHAELHKQIKYYAVPLNLEAIKHAIFQGNPVIIGIQLFDSFMSEEVARTGMVPMPDKASDQIIGGHAMNMIGWNDETQRFIVQNSWGEWADHGYCYIPYAYILDPELGDDYWTLTFFA